MWAMNPTSLFICRACHTGRDLKVPKDSFLVGSMEVVKTQGQRPQGLYIFIGTGNPFIFYFSSTLPSSLCLQSIQSHIAFLRAKILRKMGKK